MVHVRPPHGPATLDGLLCLGEPRASTPRGLNGLIRQMAVAVSQPADRSHLTTHVTGGREID